MTDFSKEPINIRRSSNPDALEARITNLEEWMSAEFKEMRESIKELQHIAAVGQGALRACLKFGAFLTAVGSAGVYIYHTFLAPPPH